MTAEEAIKLLRLIDIRGALQEDYDAVDVAIEALHRQIPLKPISKQFGTCNECWYCPSCNTFLGDCNIVRAYGYNNCPNCGQSLDISDGE